MTFTSRQQPQDGPDGQSCTNWRVTMFFDDNGGTYTIGAPAAGYQALSTPVRTGPNGPGACPGYGEMFAEATRWAKILKRELRTNCGIKE